jgi:acetylornithine deacetylase/succinyl-diaminopimelate desuccinylase-like protein
MTDALKATLNALTTGRKAALDRLFELLRIPSISTDPSHFADCDRAADWCARELSTVGIEASVRKTTGRPMVVGTRRTQQPGRPHVLFYGHYDVQPVDPLSLWSRPPFDPSLAEDATNGPVIVGRGAADDKGQLMTFVEACRAWISATGDLPISVTVLLEGEEESGSPSLEPFLKGNAMELSHDLALVCDTGQWSKDTPAITTMLRGIAFTELVVSGPDRDLHSGMYGGAALNPIRALTHILAGMHDENGRIQIPSFYDGILEPPAEQVRQWAGLGFDPHKFLGGVGLKEPVGERGRSVLEQIWARPTAEINGIWGGHSGPGSKTIVPRAAHAKVSFRLVAHQEPGEVAGMIREYIAQRKPAGLDATVSFTGPGVRPAFSPVGSPAVAAGKRAMERAFGREVLFTREGGSGPEADLADTLGAPLVFIATGLDEDQIHAPNERVDMVRLLKGAETAAYLWDELAALS